MYIHLFNEVSNMRQISLLEMKMGMKAKTFKRQKKSLEVQASNKRFERRVQDEAKSPPLGVIRS
jgi:hypothetical protein